MPHSEDRGQGGERDGEDDDGQAMGSAQLAGAEVRGSEHGTASGAPPRRSASSPGVRKTNPGLNHLVPAPAGPSEIQASARSIFVGKPQYLWLCNANTKLPKSSASDRQIKTEGRDAK